MIYIGGQEENCEKILEGKNMPWSDIIHSSLYIFSTIILRINNVSKGKRRRIGKQSIMSENGYVYMISN